MNGDSINSFSPKKGLHQGDPISTYLFVLCVERPSHFIQKKVDEGSWKPIRIARGALCISHLFTKDLLLFVEAFFNQMEVVLDCLNTFSRTSGTLVNAGKTKVFFYKGVNHTITQFVLHMVGFNFRLQLI